MRGPILLLLICWLPIQALAQPGNITVVYTSEAAPYNEALDGLRSTLGKNPLATVDLQSPNGSAQLASSLERGSKLIITIGGAALEAVNARSVDAPLLATMIMRSEQGRRQRASSTVHLDIPLTEIFAALKVVVPHKTRAAVIRNPTAAGQVDPAAIARSRQLGFTVQVVDASNPEELLRALHSLKGQVDLVVCLPDSALYNGTTVKPLILASLESHLLVVGFSPSFVRAGAAIGVYPDFRDIGAQTGEFAQRQLAGQPAGLDEGPRKVAVAVNQRVFHLLGLDFEPQRSREVVIFR